MSTSDDVVERIQLAPDAGLVKSLGANHTLESAIADLVDNSIDAGATRVSVRLMTKSDRLAQVEVVDNGRGMDATVVDAAMTIGHQREYGDSDLGHFGMGLKAASFGHSDVLTVWSTQNGALPVGRRIRRADFTKDFTCEVLSVDAAREWEVERESAVGSRDGTSIVWTQVRNAYGGRSQREARAWLAARTELLRTHLAVTFHRLLASRRLQIDVLVDELGLALPGPGIPLLPIDPFAYKAPGHPEYPKDLVATVGDQRIKLTCHVWPAKSDVTGFRLGAKAGEQFQGFYFYRNDRLLQVGGWSDAATPSPARQLARVILEDDDAIGPFVTMNPEKCGLKFESGFHDALSRAEALDGTTFLTFLQDAESVYKSANTRRRQRKPVIRPDKGLAPAVRKRIGSELPLIDGDALHVKWRSMPRNEFLDIDLSAKTVWLNSHYRSMFSPAGGSLNDAPVLKTLLFLLTHHVFEGQHLGARDKDEIALWKAILGTAAETEQRMRGD